MIKLWYENQKYYYCVYTESYYNSKYEKVAQKLAQKLDKINKTENETLTKGFSNFLETNKEYFFSSYLRNNKDLKLTTEDLKEIINNKKSRHESVSAYLKRIKERYNLKWTVFNFKATTKEKSTELSKLLTKEKINYKIEEKINFIIDLPIYLIDYQNILERIDEITLGGLLKK